MYCCTVLSLSVGSPRLNGCTNKLFRERALHEVSTAVLPFRKLPAFPAAKGRQESIGLFYLANCRRWLDWWILPDTTFCEKPMNRITRGDILDLRGRLRTRIKIESPQAVGAGLYTVNKAISAVGVILRRGSERFPSIARARTFSPSRRSRPCSPSLGAISSPGECSALRLSRGCAAARFSHCKGDS